MLRIVRLQSAQLLMVTIFATFQPFAHLYGMASFEPIEGYEAYC